MNREETKSAIEVMQAFVDGEPIEQKAEAGNYGGPIEPKWNWEGHADQYRIKPAEPREFWIHPDKLDLLPLESLKQADHPIEYIKVREVIE